MIDLTLAILAGGAGRRLGGVAKGLLRIEGRTILERLLLLAPLAREVLLVANEPEPYARFGLRAVADVVPERGAPGGVHAALASANTSWVLAVACDMPFVTAEAIAPLLDAAHDAEIVVYGEAHLQPFPGLFASRLAGEWGSALAGSPSMQALCRRFGHVAVPLERLRAVDPQARALASVNTPDDVRRLQIEWPAGSSA